MLKELGVEITVEECEQTMACVSMPFVAHWYAKHRWEGLSIEETASTIVGRAQAMLCCQVSRRRRSGCIEYYCRSGTSHRFGNLLPDGTG